MNESILTVSCDCQDIAEADAHRKSHHEDKTIRELIARMNRIEGQIRGILNSKGNLK